MLVGCTDYDGSGQNGAAEIISISRRLEVWRGCAGRLEGLNSVGAGAFTVTGGTEDERDEHEQRCGQC